MIIAPIKELLLIPEQHQRGKKRSPSEGEIRSNKKVQLDVEEPALIRNSTDSISYAPVFHAPSITPVLEKCKKMIKYYKADQNGNLVCKTTQVNSEIKLLTLFMSLI